LVEPLAHLRLVVVEVHLRRAAHHVQVDDVLRLRDEVRALGGRLPSLAPPKLGGMGGPRRRRGKGFPTKGHEGGPADGAGAAAQELAAGFQADPLLDDGGDRLRRAGPLPPATSGVHRFVAAAAFGFHLFSTSSRFINWFTSIVQAASRSGASAGSAFVSPTATSCRASFPWSR